MSCADKVVSLTRESSRARFLKRLVHLSPTRSSSSGTPARIEQKLWLRYSCHPGLRVVTHLGSVGWLPRSSTMTASAERRRVASRAVQGGAHIELRSLPYR